METIRRAIALAHKEQRALVGALPLLFFSVSLCWERQPLGPVGLAVRKTAVNRL